MARPARSLEENDARRREILLQARELVERGYENFSMRSLAARLGITPTTLYNYFSCRDEIEIGLAYMGFAELYSKLESEYTRHEDPTARLADLGRVYIGFAMNNPRYYDLLMNPRVQTTEYIGTEFEGLSSMEKESSMRVFEIMRRAVGDLMKARGVTDEEEIYIRTVRAWGELHGLLNLYNSGTLYEVNQSALDLIAQAVMDLLMSIAVG